MRLSFDDVKNIIGDTIEYFDGNPEIWLRMIWALIEKNNMNFYDSKVDKICTLTRVYSMCWIYSNFSAVFYDTYSDIIDMDIDYSTLAETDDYTCDDVFDCQDDDLRLTVETYLKNIICTSENVSEIFGLLAEELGISKTFASLYYSLQYSQFSDDEYDDEAEIYDEILNNVSADKSAAYEWLDSYMGQENVNKSFPDANLNYLPAVGGEI